MRCLVTAHDTHEGGPVPPQRPSLRQKNRSPQLFCKRLGGEVLSEQEWEEEHSDDVEFDIENISPNKRPFLEEVIEQEGKRQGPPVALEGTTTAIRTVVAGETNLITSRHEGRCCMSERQNSFRVICDDPDVLQPIRDASRREELINAMRTRIEGAAVLWNLAEAMFQLPSYFAFRVQIQSLFSWQAVGNLGDE